MYAKVFYICLIAAVSPCLTWASSYLQCTTPEQCKTSMQHEFKQEYYVALTTLLDRTLIAIDNAAEIIGQNIPDDDERQMQLDAIRHAVEEQLEILNGEVEDDKLVTINLNSQLYRQQLHKLNTEGIDVKAQKDHVKTATVRMYQAIFENWTSAGKLKGNVEVPGYDEIDADVQKALDTDATDDHMEFIIGTLTRVLNFYGLRKLNVFNYM